MQIVVTPSARLLRRLGAVAVLAAIALVPADRTHASDGKIPVLAFYYMWYSPATWSLKQMTDLPPVKYSSADPKTIDRQIRQASNAGIDGFIGSWWGAGDPTDTNFATLQARAAAFRQKTGRHFTTAIYLETDAPRMGTPQKIAQALKYVMKTYVHSPYYFHWQGKPVIFIWDALGGGRTLATWTAIRKQVDPGHTTLWSVDGTDTSVLSVFDGLHVFSAEDWSLPNNTVAATDQAFRAKIDAFNRANGTHRIWAAGVEPGWNDTRVPGRAHPHVVPRRDGATYRESWSGALTSRPDWITITTFNEWFEGSNIEPSVHFGKLYLRITRQFTKGQTLVVP